jgi:cytidyltransferase-like protein
MLFQIKSGGIMKANSSYNSLRELRKKYKHKKIGLCHGVFDILHIGHVDHFLEAKTKCDILVVSITDDRFVKKGPMQPYNDSKSRIKFLKNIETVNYVFLDKSNDACKVIEYLEPNFYFKGQDYLKKDNDLNEKLEIEIKYLKKKGGIFVITSTPLKSSSAIINKFLSNFTAEQSSHLKKINKYGGINKIKKDFEKLSNLEIDIIGEIIMDEYIDGEIVGLTSKDPSISILHKKRSIIPGGVLSMVKICASFVKKVNFYAYGEEKKIRNIFKDNKNIKIIFISKKFPLQIKTRFINENRNEKLLQVTNFKNFDNQNFKKKIKFKNNLIICDFGVGLFKNDFLEYMDALKVNKYINVQTNSMNYGYNLFSKYKKYNYIKYLCLDDREWKLGFTNPNLKPINIRKKFKKFQRISLGYTKGKSGSYLISKNDNIYSPVYIKTVKDITGCGDAFFIITSLFKMIGAKNIFIPFIGNIYAGMHAQHIANKFITQKGDLLKFINSILK